MDGFQKLVRLGLKDVQEREAVHVLVDCCLQEKSYNPYYAHLAQKLCEFKKANQVSHRVVSKLYSKIDCGRIRFF